MEEVKKVFYPSGSVRAEVRSVRGVQHGVQRTWHPNGVLASEVPFERGLQHGTCRYWNQKGELLGENTLAHGTGIVKIWFENGSVKSEGGLKAGNPHGRVRAWDESGKLISESYWIEGRRVSKKKYLEAVPEDADLPRCKDGAGSPPSDIEPRSRAIGSVAPSERQRRVHNETIEKLLGTQKAEAMEWLRCSPKDVTRSVAAFGVEQSLQLVRAAYDAGAAQVMAVDIKPPFEGQQSTDKLLIRMPDQREARKRLLTWLNNETELDGYSPDEDWGQQYFFVWFD